MQAPWLSLVMPVHNGARWLAQTLDSVASEPCDGIELLILDSSADQSCEAIVCRYAPRLTIHYRRCPDLLPWTAKTNAAVAAAAGTYIAMLHQDDLWLPGRVAAMRRMIAAWPDAALFLNPSQIVDGAGRPLGLWRCPLPADRLLDASRFGERLLVQNFVAIPAPVVRRDAWLRAGGMDESLWYTADWDLYLKLARQGPAIYSATPTTAFRIHPDSLTVAGSRDEAGFMAQMQQVIDRHIDFVTPGRQAGVLKRARASARVNGALAAAAHGRRGALATAAATLLALNPIDGLRYLRDSRLIERVWPRLRARMAGGF